MKREVIEKIVTLIGLTIVITVMNTIILSN